MAKRLNVAADIWFMTRGVGTSHNGDWSKSGSRTGPRVVGFSLWFLFCAHKEPVCCVVWNMPLPPASGRVLSGRPFQSQINGHGGGGFPFGPFQNHQATLREPAAPRRGQAACDVEGGAAGCSAGPVPPGLGRGVGVGAFGRSEFLASSSFSPSNR